MPKDRTLKAALDRHKGVNHRLEHQKKLQRQADKRKRQKTEHGKDDDALEDGAVLAQATTGVPDGGNILAQSNGGAEREDLEAVTDEADPGELQNGQAEASEADEGEGVEDGGVGFDFEGLDDSDSGSEDDEQPTRNGTDLLSHRIAEAQNGAGDEDEDTDEEDIPLSDLDSIASEDKEDVVPHQRLTINNTTALQKALKSIQLPSSLPFSANQTVVSSEPVEIADVEDDLSRELAFYKQALDAVKAARLRLKAEGVAFTRPADYFAEMVKSEEQMGKVKRKLVDQAASKKAASEARKQRDLRKFGKQVQVAKLQERAKEKRDTMDKINTLKRKRQGAELGAANEENLFDVALEDAAETERKDKAARRASGSGARGGRDAGASGRKRQRKDEKFGFGGKKRFAKSNDAQSTADASTFSVRKMKGKTGAKQRPGKSRRNKT